jgi:hypothetical protein
MDEAFDKASSIAHAAAEPYQGGPDGVAVRWEFVGVTSVLPIYEELEDGVEIVWEEHRNRKLKTLRNWVADRAAFHQIRRAEAV